MIILVGFDGSNSSKEALYLACTYAKSLGAEIRIVTSMEEGNAEDVSEIRTAEGQLAWAETHASNSGVPASSHLLIRGLRPGEDVVKYARENDADVIFIGVRRRSKVGKLLFGSNAQFIILKAPCPVMTVR